jgi:hypothetical protein
MAFVCAAGQDHSLRIRQADEDKLYEVSQKGTEKTYVEFLSPREKGQHLLMLGDDMWVYLPDTSRPVRITPLERSERRRLQRRRGAHQLCRRLFGRLSAHGEGGKRELLRARSDRQAQRLDLSAHSLLAADGRMRAR